MQVGIDDDDSRVCQNSGCTEVDLLAARCSFCRKLFCSQHIQASEHNCAAQSDARVASCPICARIVPLEYPGQKVDEAVSRHLDRRCRDALPPPRAVSARPSTGGQRLGAGRAGGGTCAFVDCPQRISDVVVTCPQCRRTFCLDHRLPSQHRCERLAHRTTSGSPSSNTEKQKAASLRGSQTYGDLLSNPLNQPETAFGKMTESPQDSITALICFLVPVNPSKDAKGQKLQPIQPFFMHLKRTLSLGRVLDLVLEECTKLSPDVRANRGVSWNVHVVPVPCTNATMVTPTPLSTIVSKTPLSTAPRGVIFVSHFSTLPSEALKALIQVQENTNNTLQSDTKSSDSCVCL